MEIRQVNAKQGIQWLLSGFYLFRRAPIAWVLVCGALFLIAISAALIPFVGSFIFTLIYPALQGGIMLGCRDLEAGKSLEISHLFSAIESHLASLITVGGIYITGLILVSGLAVIVGGPEMTDMFLHGKRFDETQIIGITSNILTSLLILVTLSIPLMMASTFAPMLVVFHKMPPVMAMQQSLFACLRNIFPFAVYTIALTLLMVIALLPYAAGLVILIPTMFASMYVSYKDIFLGEPIQFKDNSPPFSTQWDNSQESSQQKENSDKDLNNDTTRSENSESDKK